VRRGRRRKVVVPLARRDVRRLVKRRKLKVVLRVVTNTVAGPAVKRTPVTIKARRNARFRNRSRTRRR